MRIRKRFDARKFVREVFDLDALEKGISGIKAQMERDAECKCLVSAVATGGQNGLEAALVFFDILDADAAFRQAANLDPLQRWEEVSSRADATAEYLNTVLARVLGDYFLAFAGAPYGYGLYLYKGEA